MILFGLKFFYICFIGTSPGNNGVRKIGVDKVIIDLSKLDWREKMTEFVKYSSIS